jgi:hypothetical protein
MIVNAAGAAAQNDLVIIDGGTDCGVKVNEFQTEYYRFRGQSVYFSNRTNGLTTGGQLDGFDCRSDDLAQFRINFFEVFPEVELTDYLTFGYFGIVETYILVDTDGDGIEDAEQVTDTSFVMAVRDGLGEGTKVEDYFPNLDEATLVTALTTTFDSPEFFEALFAATENPDLRGDIGLNQANAGFTTNIRPFEQLSLVAFRGGDNGDEGRALGYMTTSIIRIPDRLCADQNGDGLVSPTDFSAFVANFNARNLRADVNGDGEVSPADFSAWVTQFNLGMDGQACLN